MDSATTKAEFIQQFFELAPAAQENGLVIRRKTRVEEFMSLDEFIDEAKTRKWTLLDLNDQIIGYKKIKSREFNLKILC